MSVKVQTSTIEKLINNNFEQKMKWHPEWVLKNSRSVQNVIFIIKGIIEKSLYKKK